MEAEKSTEDAAAGKNIHARARAQPDLYNTDTMAPLSADDTTDDLKRFLENMEQPQASVDMHGQQLDLKNTSFAQLMLSYLNDSTELDIDDENFMDDEENSYSGSSREKDSGEELQLADLADDATSPVTPLSKEKQRTIVDKHISALELSSSVGPTVTAGAAENAQRLGASAFYSPYSKRIPTTYIASGMAVLALGSSAANVLSQSGRLPEHYYELLAYLTPRGYQVSPPRTSSNQHSVFDVTGLPNYSPHPFRPFSNNWGSPTAPGQLAKSKMAEKEAALQTEITDLKERLQKLEQENAELVTLNRNLQRTVIKIEDRQYDEAGKDQKLVLENVELRRKLDEMARKIAQQSEYVQLQLLQKIEMMYKEAARPPAPVVVYYPKVFASGPSKAKNRAVIKLRDSISLLRQEHDDLRMFSGLMITKYGENLTRDSIVLESKMKELFDKATHFSYLYAAEFKQRKLVFNQLYELRGNIRVFVRVRPLLDHEKPDISNTPTCVSREKIFVKDVYASRPRECDYEFDRVFNPESKQAEVFEEIRWLATSILDGFNVCIMAYGYTGSGKTHTMFGPPSVYQFEGRTLEDRGINFRILEELFKLTNQRKEEYSYKFKVSMMEVYNDAVFDLLLRDPSQLRYKKLHVQMLHNNVVTIPGLIEQTVSDASEVMSLLNQGIANRKMDQTYMNETSSRSHALLQLQIEGVDKISKESTLGQLYLIDLAGSESYDTSKNTGETININSSLSALGDVLEALAKKQNHIPYRNSKLTQILQSGLKKGSKAVMFVNINPCCIGETIRSLDFANRIKQIGLGPAQKRR